MSPKRTQWNHLDPAPSNRKQHDDGDDGGGGGGGGDDDFIE